MAASKTAQLKALTDARKALSTATYYIKHRERLVASEWKWTDEQLNQQISNALDETNGIVAWIQEQREQG